MKQHNGTEHHAEHKHAPAKAKIQHFRNKETGAFVVAEHPAAGTVVQHVTAQDGDWLVTEGVSKIVRPDDFERLYEEASESEAKHASG